MSETSDTGTWSSPRAEVTGGTGGLHGTRDTALSTNDTGATGGTADTGGSLLGDTAAAVDFASPWPPCGNPEWSFVVDGEWIDQAYDAHPLADGAVAFLGSLFGDEVWVDALGADPELLVDRRAEWLSFHEADGTRRAFVQIEGLDHVDILGGLDGVVLAANPYIDEVVIDATAPTPHVIPERDHSAVLLTRFDPHGTLEWVRQITSDDAIWYLRTSATPDGEIYAAFKSESPDTLVLAPDQPSPMAFLPADAEPRIVATKWASDGTPFEPHDSAHSEVTDLVATSDTRVIAATPAGLWTTQRVEP